MTRPVGLVASSHFLRHDAGPGALERPERLLAVEAELERRGLLGELDRIEPAVIDRELVETIHANSLIEQLEATEGRAATSLDPDTHAGPDSYPAARLASGGLLEAAERVLDATWSSAFVIARPPGHHAESGRAMGFCLINHVAIVARALQARHGVERVAIVDWDVHHGNGTQHTFESDPSVFYASLHQWPLYPGTGAASERGEGDGKGTTLNVPLAPGTTDVDWLGAFEDEVLPALEEFRPNFVLVSAGFDAHADDAISATRLTDGAYRRMTEGLLELSNRTDARLVSLLEGGYELAALGRSAAEHVSALVEAST